MSANTRTLVVCDGATVPAPLSSEAWTVRRTLRSRGPDANLQLYGENLGYTVLREITDRAVDLIHIASYVYAADQEVSRGGPADVYGRAWQRQIAICIPVADPAYWRQAHVKDRLRAALGFGTEDDWEFAFDQAPAGARMLSLLEGEEQAKVLGHPDSVLLFSGGADSLCAAVQAVASTGGRPVLVSHSPVLNQDSRQKALADELRRRFPTWGFPHLGFPIHRRGSDPADSSQRSRGFLYACLGAAVGAQLGVGTILLPDNGIVSLNLPINPGIVGAHASRSTHPRFIDRFNDLLEVVLPIKVRVSNPLWNRTRSEALALLAETGCPSLLGQSLSCSHPHRRPRGKPQCGYCFQCVDRRFGVIAAGLAEYDPADRFGLDIFHDSLAEGEQRTIASSYVNFARELDDLDEDDVLETRQELYECLPLDDSAPRVASELVRLLKRHAASVVRVMGNVVAQAGVPLVKQVVAPDSLVWLALGVPQPPPPVEPAENSVVYEGSVWALTFEGRTIRLKGKGLEYIAILLQNPGQAISALKLAAGDSRPPSSQITELQATEEGLHVGPDRGRGHVVDEQATREYQAQAQQLLAQRADAELRGDLQAVEELDDQIETLTGQIKAGRGRRGRPRQFTGPEQKAADAVSRAITRSIDRIGDQHRALATHLDRAITRGAICWCRSDLPLPWRVKTRP